MGEENMMESEQRKAGWGKFAMWVFWSLCVFGWALVATQAMAATRLQITEAEWESEDSQLEVEGKGKSREKITVFDANSGSTLGYATVSSRGKWKLKVRNPQTVPSRVRATGYGQTAERDVEHAPRNGGGSPSITLTNLAVQGPASVPENSSATYTATASFSDGSSQQLTSGVAWSENSSYATINGAGVLAANQVSGNQTVLITAQYSYGGTAQNAVLSVTITDTNVKSLTGLAISGPASVPENSSATYTATASFSDGTSQQLTSGVTWSENSSYATIGGNGVLTAGNVSSSQTAIIKASYTYDNATQSAEVPVTIVDTTALTGLTVSGPTTIPENSSATYTATASFSDGTSQQLTSEVVWSENSSYASVSSAGLFTTTEVSGDQIGLLTASYSFQGITRTATLSFTIQDTSAPPVTGSHAGRFASFEGTKTCLTCHTEEAKQVHGSVHYQWKGDSSATLGLGPEDAGKLGGINDFCIYPDINWIGKLTNVNGDLVDGGCAKCHTGLGEKPDPSASQAQLENIDCLVCHSQSYKRKVDSVDGKYRFVPDTENMTVGVLQAAADITLPSKDSCLNCHTKSGGGNNFKRGDIEEAHRSASRSFDVHMASIANGGAGLECLDCHTSVMHRVAGRGTDLRPIDSAEVLSCTKCHSSRPHGESKIDKHTARVNCTVCHIPTYAKVAATDLVRDWSQPGDLVQSSGLYEPHMTKQTNVIPEYRFFNGLSHFYKFGDPAIPGDSGKVLMSGPDGTIQDSTAKIYAFKHHFGKQPVDPGTRALLPLKIGKFFESGDLPTAVELGVNGVGWSYQGYEFADTERYMGLFHEVAPKENALSCNSCHNGGNRLDFATLGYSPNSTYNGRPLCASCHSDKSREWSGSEYFSKVHEKHVTDKKYDCSRCHTFSSAN